MVRDLVVEMLEQFGFRTLSARDGLEAVRIYREAWREISLVILDMIMPKLGGKDTFEQMKKVNPGVRALLSTGFSADHAIRDFLDEGYGHLHSEAL